MLNSPEFVSLNTRKYDQYFDYINNVGDTARKLINDRDYQNLLKELKEGSISITATLNYCCFMGNLPVLKLLINEFDYDVNAEDNLLKRSVYLGKYNITKFLLENNANVTAEDNIAIKIMAKRNNSEMIKILIDYGADIHVDNEYPLRCSAHNKNYDNVTLLLQYGVDIHADNDFTLRKCCYDSNYIIVKLLLEHGANVHADNDYPLIISAMFDSYECAKLLLEYGANVHANNEAALKYSAEDGYYETTKLLLESGATVTAEILSYAICHPEGPSLEIIKLLLDYCSDVSILNDIVITPDKKTQQIIELVTSRGISLEKMLMMFLWGQKKN